MCCCVGDNCACVTYILCVLVVVAVDKTLDGQFSIYIGCVTYILFVFVDVDKASKLYICILFSSFFKVLFPHRLWIQSVSLHKMYVIYFMDVIGRCRLYLDSEQVKKMSLLQCRRAQISKFYWIIYGDDGFKYINSYVISLNKVLNRLHF